MAKLNDGRDDVTRLEEIVKSAYPDGHWAKLDKHYQDLGAAMEEFVKAADSKKPYGDVKYADPGYQEDGKKRYPLDTETHIRAAWSYINQKGNQSPYSASQLSAIKGRIRSAMKKIGAEVSDSGS